MPRRRAPVSDWHLWQDVTKSVEPLRRRPARPGRRVATGPEAEAQPDTARTAAIEPAAPPPLPRKRVTVRPDPDTPPPGHRFVAQPLPATIDTRTQRRIGRGRDPIDSTLDLHGMRQHEAHPVLIRFIKAAVARGDRTVLIITGKGVKRTGFAQFEQIGILRHLVPAWLADPGLKPFVAGIGTSAQSHGGTGAIYVRLKRAGRR
ncbi:Smr/MutS family protein [Cucumibacter marinus]|uniref:Smr/MutS family protein n=1 Tax=Cucumibacter marinus TaxID=1121252 RepID=UPI0004051962|nr:Smr/MutS family protein [Cucumibacter marinus]